MNDQDYIRAGAALADGFQLTTDQAYFSLPHGGFVPSVKHVVETETFNQYKDALAAQLVRQVDATDGYFVTTHIGQSRINSSRNGDQIATEISEDRTMNTIKAIVDSGVLSTGGSGK